MVNYMKMGLLFFLAFAVLVVAAKPDFVSADAGHSKHNAQVTMPEHAAEVAPGVFYLGTAMHGGQQVEGYAFVRYKDAYGKPSGCNNDGICQKGEAASCGDCVTNKTPAATCYAFLSKGARWKAIEPYVVNPSNTRGLDGTFIAANLATDIGKWEGAAAADILGVGTTVSEPLSADTSAPDGKNEVYFANVDKSGAIAITIVWGVFRGSAAQKQLVEWDQVYDDVDYDWSASGEAGKMDFENIATHELGHSVGMSDLYSGSCGEETMYGYANYGETKKRTLESGDITGVKLLYGS
jgi:hypothetical protein